MTDFGKYQTDVLIVLVGTNPLPGYVAAMLLAKPAGQVYFLHTDATLSFADELATLVVNKQSQLTVTPLEISKSDPQQIERQLGPLIKAIGPNAHIGLNYTGGSKPMAALAYHIFRKEYPKGIFSYLDADSLSFVIESPGIPTQWVSAARSVDVDLEALFKMHGFILPDSGREPMPQVLSQALVEVNRTKSGYAEWRRWLQQFSSGKPTLSSLAQFPTLSPVISAFATLCGNQPVTEDNVAMRLGHQKLVSCSKILIGYWLEDSIYYNMKILGPELGLHQVSLGINPKHKDRRSFEYDVVATLGYQLYAVSCMTSENVQSVKDHFMETFVRAKQIGGDEACCSLVCCIDEPDQVEKEITEGWGLQGKIRVFGREHLTDMHSHLREWIIKASIMA